MDPHPPFFFNGWYFVIRTATLSLTGFIALIILLRGSGKRTLSKMNVFDFVFVVAVGSVFAASIIEKDVTLVEGMVSLGVLVGVQAILAKIAVYSRTFEKIINGEPALLLSKGKFIESALKKERVTKEEVRGAIRSEGITRVEDVDAVIIENDGSLSVAWLSKREDARGSDPGPGALPEGSSLVDAKDPKGRKPRGTAS